MTYSITRRQFVEAAAIGAATLGPALHLSGKEPASGRVRLGLVGCGGRGRELLEVVRDYDDVDIVAVSDVNEPRMDQALEVLTSAKRRHRAEKYVEHERILDRQDVDAVLIATTQHWHGRPFIQAALAGKHVYVEKPLSHTVREGRAMVEAARKTGITAVMGTQQRNYPHFVEATEIVRSGRLGKIALVECWNYHNTGQRVGRAADADPPPGLHWDRWLGPAPYVPYNPSRMNNSWWYDYAGGMMTNWAIHHIDIILGAMGAASPTSVSSSGGKFVVDDLADTPDTQEASWEFPGFLMQFTYRGFNNFHSLSYRPNNHGICFHGTKATLVLDRSGYDVFEERDIGRSAEKVDNPRHYRDGLPGNEVDGPWQRLFIDCLKDGRDPPVSLEESHQATVCCHLANIAQQTGRKFRWDGQTETISDDAEAAAMLARPRRSGYELPKV